MLSARGLDVAPGTLADSLPRLAPPFAPLAAAIAERQAAARVARGDETSWTVHACGERGDSPRCWLWVCLTADSVRLRGDPSRSAAARELFGDLGSEAPAYLVCDRCAACARLAREEPERFVPGARAARLRRRHRRPSAAREVVRTLAGTHRDAVPGQRPAGAALGSRPAPGRQGAAFAKAQRRLERGADALFERARRELAALPADAPRGRPLRALRGAAKA